MWTLKLAPHFQTVTGRDFSVRMLARAKQRAQNVAGTVTFREGNILEVDEADASQDWVFVSFALHLFPLDVEVRILKDLLRVAREGVMIIDHSRKWTLSSWIAEWIEGSHYDHFIRTDFAPIANEIGASAFEETHLTDCMVLTFVK